MKGRQMTNENKKRKNTTSNKNAGKANYRRKQPDAVEAKTGNSLSSWKICVVMLAVTFGFLHGWHISSMFENDRFFSHLSDLEREMTFRTEMGLYFSYYKTMVEAPAFIDGLYQITHDNLTEYPSQINTLKRFNLYPEVVLAALKRSYESIMFVLKMPTKFCYTVHRGRGLDDVSNCEGMGDIAYFYVNMIFLENAIMMSAFFLFGVYLSGSIFGGLLTVTTFFYNHGECTRVQWTPPLRESFGYPVFILQMFITTHTLRIAKPGWKQSILIMLTSVGFMLAWQFAQFTLLTQILAVFGTYVLGFIDSHHFRVILQGQSLALFFSYILLFGNEMLLTSFFASCLITLWVIIFLEPIIYKTSHTILIWIIQGIILIAGILGFKFLISTLLHIQDDAHIANLFKSKFFSYRDFHTMLYVCAAEFDFLQFETIQKLTVSLLLPGAITAFLLVTFYLIVQEYGRYCQKSVPAGDSVVLQKSPGTRPLKPNAELVYHLFQTLAFSGMALIIMRLKLFFTPQLCLMCSLLASRKVLYFIKERTTHIGVVVLIIALMSAKGIGNLRHQWSIVGDFSNAPQEELLEWIKASTPTDAVFAGAMPTMASIKLSTLRPVVNHPHYEDAGLRKRTKMVYTMYSRKPPKKVYANIKKLGATHVVLEMSWCTKRSRPGCALPEIWDIEDPENHNKEPVCLKLARKPKPYFNLAFKNDVYMVLKLT